MTADDSTRTGATGGPGTSRKGRRRFFRLRYFLAGLVLLLGVLAAAGYLCRDRLLNDLVRPWLERTLAEKLSAEVGIGRITLAPEGVDATGISIVRPGRFQITVDRVLAEATLAGLLQRQVAGLVLVSPEILLQPAAGPAAELPARPSLTVKRLAIENGKIDFAGADRSWQLHGIEAETALTERFPFRLSAFPGAGEDLSLSVRGEGTWKDTLSLTFAEARWDGRELLASPLTVILPREAGPSAGGSFRLDRFDCEQLDRFLAAFGVASPLPQGWCFALTAPEADFRLGKETTVIRLEVPEGNLNKEGFVLPLGKVHLELARKDGTWRVEGAFVLAGEAPGKIGASLERGSLEGHLTLTSTDPAELIHRLVGGSRLAIAGGMTLAADFRAAAGSLELQADLKGLAAERKTEKYLLDATPLQARLELRRSDGGMSGKGRLFLSGRKITEVAGTGSRVRFDLLPMTWAELKKIAGPGLLPALVRDARGIAGKGSAARLPGGRWRGEVDLGARDVALPGGSAREVRLAGRFDRSGDSLDISDAAFSAKVATGGLAGGVAAAGSGSLAKGSWQVRFNSLAVKNLEYLSADGMSGLSGGWLRGTGKMIGELGKGAVRFDLFTDFGASEALRGALYADLSKQTAHLALEGRLETAGRRLEAEDLTLAVDGVGLLKLQGTFTPDAARIAGLLSLPSLAEAFGGHLKSVLGESFPALKPIDLAGAATGEFTGGWESGHLRLKGEIRTVGLDASWPGARLAIQGGTGSIPFDLAPGAGPETGVGPEERKGIMTFAALTAGPVQLAPGPVRLAAVVNRFAVLSPLVFDIGGGTLEVRDFSARWTDSHPGFQASVVLRQVDLGILAGEIGLPPMQGRIAADLGEIRYRDDVLSTEGTAGINVFDGSILVSNMKFQEPFSRYPTFSADIDFSGIDLFPLTHAFAFGEMNGIADGYIHDLRLFGLTPSQFDLKFETRERGKRNISVKALRNLTILSQGGLSAALSRGIYRFIDFYRYRKIGFLFHLENDVFRLRGMARPGSNRYLVYGGWLPPKIDIIAPEHAISFKEMLKRLSRVERAESRK